MKANELMVGDYLRVNRDGLCIPKGTVVLVSEIDSENTFREKGLKGSARCEAMDDTWLSGGIWCDHLDPIPLTPEILEKNGWKETWGWWSSDDCPFFMVKYADNSWAKGKYGVSFSEDKEADMFFIGSVHELQHALRLCGIEKEITL